MSAYALLIGLAHVSGTPEVISGPEIPYEEQRKRFKEVMPLRVHKHFRQIQFVDSRRGVRKKKNFLSPAQAKAAEKTIAAEEKAAGKPAGDPPTE